MPADAFRHFLNDHPMVAVKLLPMLTRILRRNTEQIHDAAFLDVPARMARTLLSLASGGQPDVLPPVTASTSEAIAAAPLEQAS